MGDVTHDELNLALGSIHASAQGWENGYQSYTTTEKNKLANIAAGAEVNVQADWNATSGDAFIKNKPSTFPPSAHSHTEITATDNSAGAAASSNSMIVGAGNSSIDITDSSIGVSTNSFKWNNKTILTEGYAPEITSMSNDYCEIGIGGDAYISAWEGDNSADITVSVDNGVSVSTSDGLSFSWNGNEVATEADLAGKQDKITSSNKLAYSLISGTPTIPAAPGTLNTNNSTAQTASSSEALSGTIKLHKVSKTGSYNDLNNKPTIPTVDSSMSSSSTNPVQNKVINTELNKKQDKLTSGTNIKTINGESVLGSGNIAIQSGGSSINYCSGRGSGTMSGTSSPAKVSVSLNVLSSPEYFTSVSGGIKCMKGGVIMVSGSVYYTTSNSGRYGAYIYNGITEITSTYVNLTASAAVSCAPLITTVSAGDIIYLYERASTSSTVEKANAATHLDIVYLETITTVTFSADFSGSARIWYAEDDYEDALLYGLTEPAVYEDVICLSAYNDSGATIDWGFAESVTVEGANTFDGPRTTYTNVTGCDAKYLFPTSDLTITHTW